MSRETFSPSNLQRRRLCPGSLTLESSLSPAPDDDDSEWSKEGRLLHDHMAYPLKDRAALTMDQVDVLDKCEKMEAEFLELVNADAQQQNPAK